MAGLRRCSFGRPDRRPLRTLAGIGGETPVSGIDAHDNADHDHTDHGPTPLEREPDPAIALQEMALRELLIEKGIFTADDIRRAMEAMEARSPAMGARVVARAWSDQAFKTALLTHGNSAVATFGVSMGVAELTVVENTPEVHNVIVCTLCSCYPRALLGIPPSWYKSKSYRSRVVRDPRGVLAEFGTTLPPGMKVRVHDSTADLRFLVLPRRPAGTDGWYADALASLVTRDCLIGVAMARAPDTTAL
ncbi:MAG: nitrile hydratase subunit alpha [Alphaproteobacteria bacterium]|nr:nitrile hydratase subunit alpha [Alphaproteobacteria bacterium]